LDKETSPLRGENPLHILHVPENKETSPLRGENVLIE